MDALRVRAEQERLEAGDGHVPWVRCGIVSIPHARSIATDAITPLIRARARGLSLTSTKCALPDSPERPAGFDERRVVRAERGIELHRDDELLPAEHPRELGLVRRGLRGVGELALAEDERRRRSALIVDRAADRLDLRGRRAAAAADDPGAEPPRLRCELGEVVRRRVGKTTRLPARLARPTFGSAASTSPSRCIEARAFSAAAGPAL